jgi:hypothetical protein
VCGLLGLPKRLLSCSEVLPNRRNSLRLLEYFTIFGQWQNKIHELVEKLFDRGGDFATRASLDRNRK